MGLVVHAKKTNRKPVAMDGRYRGAGGVETTEKDKMKKQAGNGERI